VAEGSFDGGVPGRRWRSSGGGAAGSSSSAPAVHRESSEQGKGAAELMGRQHIE
jgi:hypothetical protein